MQESKEDQGETPRSKTSTNRKEQEKVKMRVIKIRQITEHFVIKVGLLNSKN